MKIRTGVMKAVENTLIEKKNVSLPEMAKIFYPDDVDQRAAIVYQSDKGACINKQLREAACLHTDPPCNCGNPCPVP